MIIQCEKCNSKYRLDDSRINPPGSSVRCSKCGHIFFVSKKEDPENKKELLISEKTPLFEDLEEEIEPEPPHASSSLSWQFLHQQEF